MKRNQPRTVVDRRALLRAGGAGAFAFGGAVTAAGSATSPVATARVTSTRATSPPASPGAGDLVQLRADNTDTQYAMMDAGCTLSRDNLLVPRNAHHQRNAQRLIDYYHEPKVAARLAAAISYARLVAGLRDGLAKTGKEPAGNALIIPTEAMTAKARVFRSLTTAEDEAFEAALPELTGA
ncbi:hypothetical protein IPZ58_30570 [Streptomyces roseoverticillatus]|uniref:hypothetical protein n=1 Tax=Streptomyces roseoverticillatus TaxID=66429 RepID=UPI001F1F2E15|nr:hypothetical protein [Streptomyces roseoverticillatus]MCF3105894.1 hypothetical protein [Streptomyces roseoverticillatus]